MSLFETILVAFIQGFTEFLPISSSAHLVIAENLFQINTEQYFAFTIITHLATLFAVIVYNRRFLFNLTTQLLKLTPASLQTLLQLFLSSLPIVIFVLIANDFISNTFNNLTAVLVCMFLTGLFFLFSEKFKPHPTQSPQFLSRKSALIIGLFQALAVFPGISRSGITLAAGLLIGLPRTKSAEYSFLLAIPTILGASLYEYKSLNAFFTFDPISLMAGFLTSFLVAYFTIDALLKLYKSHSLIPFAIYLLLISSTLFFSKILL